MDCSKKSAPLLFTPQLRQKEAFHEPSHGEVEMIKNRLPNGWIKLGDNSLIMCDKLHMTRVLFDDKVPTVSAHKICQWFPVTNWGVGLCCTNP
jgi:hypothetical protein